MILGAESLPGQPTASPSVESDLRYFAAFYVAFGAVLLWLAPRADRETMAVRAVAAALFLGGLARAAAWAAEGRPHDLQLALLAIELGAPPLIVLWQARLAAREPATPPGRTPGSSR